MPCSDCGLARYVCRRCGLTLASKGRHKGLLPCTASHVKRSATALLKTQRQFWVGSSSSQAGEAVVLRRLTPERQVIGTVLPDFTAETSDSSGRVGDGLDRLRKLASTNFDGGRYGSRHPALHSAHSLRSLQTVVILACSECLEVVVKNTGRLGMTHSAVEAWVT